MGFLFVSLVLVTIAAGIVAVAALTFSLLDANTDSLRIAGLCTLVALAAGFGASLAYSTDQATWRPDGAIVRTIFSEGEDVMLLSKYGTVYRCVEQAECQDLEKGDHVTFEWLPGGSSVQGTPDARNVVKG